MRQAGNHCEAFVPVDPPRIEGYRVSTLLGVGGMATVWRAVHLPTGKEVALKLLDGDGRAAPAALARFEREVRLAAMLDHPLIARPHASGISNGTHYHAMHFIDGVALDVYVRERKPGRADLLRLFAAICRAVHHAHQRGIVHRDLKPANILVDAAGRPHLLDFGLAEAHGDGGTLADGEVAGTPAFMSPEQASPRGHVVDARSDVYALGALLYLLLTGQTPHDTSGSYAQVLRRIRTQPPRRLRQIDPTIPRSLEAVVLSTLEKDPGRRPESAAILAERIERCAGAPLPRKLASGVRRAVGGALRHGQAARVVILALTAGLAGPLRQLVQ